MTTPLKLTIAAALTIAGFIAIMAGNGWLPAVDSHQWALITVGSFLSATGMATALQHWFHSTNAGPGSSVGWALAKPMFMPGCGAILIATIQTIVGVFSVTISILWAWDIHWGLALAFAALGGICFGNAYATIQND